MSHRLSIAALFYCLFSRIFSLHSSRRKFCPPRPSRPNSMIENFGSQSAKMQSLACTKCDNPIQIAVECRLCRNTLALDIQTPAFCPATYCSEQCLMGDASEHAKTCQWRFKVVCRFANMLHQSLRMVAEMTYPFAERKIIKDVMSNRVLLPKSRPSNTRELLVVPEDTIDGWQKNGYRFMSEDIDDEDKAAVTMGSYNGLSETLFSTVIRKCLEIIDPRAIIRSVTMDVVPTYTYNTLNQPLRDSTDRTARYHHQVFEMILHDCKQTPQILDLQAERFGYSPKMIMSKEAYIERTSAKICTASPQTPASPTLAAAEKLHNPCLVGKARIFYEEVGEILADEFERWISVLDVEGRKIAEVDDETWVSKYERAFLGFLEERLVVLQEEKLLDYGAEVINAEDEGRAIDETVGPLWLPLRDLAEEEREKQRETDTRILIPSKGKRVSARECA